MTDVQPAPIELSRAARDRRRTTRGRPCEGLQVLRTVGVEEELLLVDPRTGRPRPVASRLLDPPPGHSGPGPLRALSAPVLEAELQQEQVEIASAPQADLALMRQDLRRLRRQADEAARSVGARVAALATSPLPVVPHLTTKPRYDAMQQRFGLTCAQALTCGCHVHVAVTSDDEGVGAIDRIRAWLPVLTALAASSPYAEGTDSGYASYRAQLQARWPSTGPSELFGSAEGYHAVVRSMMRTESLLDEGMVYFDARLSRRYPTVEVRVADVTPDVDTSVLIAALVRALVETAARQWQAGLPAPAVPLGVLRLAAWRASRFGLDEGGDSGLLSPDDLQVHPAGEVVERLVQHVGDALDLGGDREWVQRQVARLCSGGNGAQRQRLLVGAGRSLRQVVRDAVDRTQA